MPVFNAEAYLAESIESVLGQTVEDFELIAVDDGSEDGSRAILERFARLDSRVRVVANEKTPGLACGSNRGWRLSRATYVARLDADDVALPQRLSTQIAFLDAHPSVAAVGGAAITIDPSGRQMSVMRSPTSSSVIRATLPRRNCFVHSSVTMRRAALEEVGGYRFNRGGDYDLWLRLSERFDLANLLQPVVLYRVHAGQISIVAVEEVARNNVAFRAAARSRVASGKDPLAGMHELTPEVLEGLALDQSEVDRALEVALLSMASRLADLGRHEDADQLVARASLTLGGRATRAFAAARELNKARVRLNAGRRHAGAAHVLLASRHDPSYTHSRVVAALGDRMNRSHTPRPLRGRSLFRYTKRVFLAIARATPSRTSAT
jgi:glycosyltransferase involved in cell wall biosynthesis